jgi:glyoxylase-like metal-dependent hydrolase (beta-lactamase superfamily II)
MRKLTALRGNSQRLDGGAMFGNVPKGLWSRWVECDEKNRIELACRALLMEEPDGRKVLFETGIGAFFEPKMRERFGVVESRHVLLDSLAEIGLRHEDIDVVVLSHLHFDHAGGLLSPWEEEKTSFLLFPKARYIVGRRAWERAKSPHIRDRASFIPLLQTLLEGSGRLTLVDKDAASKVIGQDCFFHMSDGHTPGLLLTEISMPEGPIVFAGDLVPACAWVHLPVTMGYDRYPELLIDEKKTLLEDLVSRKGRLMYTHDHKTAISSLSQDSKGRFHATQLRGDFKKLSD